MFYSLSAFMLTRFGHLFMPSKKFNGPFVLTLGMTRDFHSGKFKFVSLIGVINVNVLMFKLISVDKML